MLDLGYKPCSGPANINFFKPVIIYEEHVLFGLNQIYYWVLKCTTCYHYTNIIKSGLINLIKIGNVFTTGKG